MIDCISAMTIARADLEDRLVVEARDRLVDQAGDAVVLAEEQRLQEVSSMFSLARTSPAAKSWSSGTRWASLPIGSVPFGK